MCVIAPTRLEGNGILSSLKEDVMNNNNAKTAVRRKEGA
jgi:hypothetical protein